MNAPARQRYEEAQSVKDDRDRDAVVREVFGDPANFNPKTLRAFTDEEREEQARQHQADEDDRAAATAPAPALLDLDRAKEFYDRPLYGPDVVTENEPASSAPDGPAVQDPRAHPVPGLVGFDHGLADLDHTQATDDEKPSKTTKRSSK